MRPQSSYRPEITRDWFSRLLKDHDVATRDLSIRAHGNWLFLEAPFETDDDEPDLLARGAMLPSGWKFAVDPMTDGLRLRFDALGVGMEDGDDEPGDPPTESRPRVSVERGLRCFRGALAAAESRGAHPKACVRPAQLTPPEGKSASDLESLLEETGYPRSDGSEGPPKVSLSGPGYHRRIEWDVRGAGELWGVVRLASLDGYGSVSRRAASRLLLRMSGMVATVRPLLTGESVVTEAWLEAELGPNPAPSDVERAAASLAVAVDMTVREVALLQDESIAAPYLDLASGNLIEEPVAIHQ